MNHILEVLADPEIAAMSLAFAFLIGFLIYQGVIVNGQLKLHISDICNDLSCYKMDTGVLMAEKERVILELHDKILLLEEELYDLKSKSPAGVISPDGVNRMYRVGDSWHTTLLHVNSQKSTRKIHEIPCKAKS